MRVSIEELESLVRSRVCAVCGGKSEAAACTPGTETRCSLFELFPLVAQAVHATESDNIQDYIDAIRENVCSVCLDQKLDGSCELRGTDTCALDTHMSDVVEIIKQATGKTFDAPVARG